MRLRQLFLIVSALGLGGAPLTAQGEFALLRERELRLALSAGPASVSRDASVYRLTPGGFIRDVEGTNGWACLVVRVTADPAQLAPHCLNPAAVETVLPALLREGEMQARGMTGDAISAELKRQFATGELPLPAGPAYAYMLSAGQRLGPKGSQFRPHFMLYLPYATNADLGGDPSKPQFPFVGPYENHPLSTLVILMEEFVDPESVILPGR